MDTTTPVDGVASNDALTNAPEITEPTKTEAVADDAAKADDSTSQDDQQIDAPAASEADSNAPEAQADDIKDWAEKKGLPLDDPVKLAQMYRDAEKKMHEATSKTKELETQMTDNLEYTGDDSDDLKMTVNQLLIQNNVREFFDRNPEAKEYEGKMAELVQQRPHLQTDLDALYALAARDTLTGKEGELKSQGGREALTNLAQKQQAIPPTANATNSTEYASSQITPQNVDKLVAENDQAWYDANRDAIRQAAFGNSPT